MTMDQDDLTSRGDPSIIEAARGRYSDKVIERWFDPPNMGVIENPHGYGKTSSSCGDTLEIFLNVKNDKIIDARFIAKGCSTTIAVGSMATELAIGKEIRESFRISHKMIINGLDGLPEDSAHCALLAANALREALKDYLNLKREPWKRAYRKF